jgi:hypothetical protein
LIGLVGREPGRPLCSLGLSVTITSHQQPGWDARSSSLVAYFDPLAMLLYANRPDGQALGKRWSRRFPASLAQVETARAVEKY